VITDDSRYSPLATDVAADKEKESVCKSVTNKKVAFDEIELILFN
jgi:hypothetical protein